MHIEGDPDHPVNRGTLCPKGAGLTDFINSPNRLKYPEYRAPGSDKWQRISWDDALDRISRLLKDDRDANFIEKNDDGKTVNRRSEEHTSELQSLMRISYAVFCLNKKKLTTTHREHTNLNQ